MAKKGAAKSGDDGARASAQGGGSPWNGKADALRVVAFVGSDAFLREERTRGLIAGIESEHGPVQVMRFDGNTCAIGDVLDECRSMGLLADRKVVVVDEADVLLKSSEDG
ncbi:MAG TPA: hypothetical protein VG797_10310, partial [Phycisphaerales bacterium]|nr:hypothetical protein [Phycisphaerales bacterium]